MNDMPRGEMQPSEQAGQMPGGDMAAAAPAATGEMPSGAMNPTAGEAGDMPSGAMGDAPAASKGGCGCGG